MKSAIGIGALLMDGLGDTIRVSLTEDPEYEMDPCKRLASIGQTACDEARGRGACCMLGPAAWMHQHGGHGGRALLTKAVSTLWGKAHAIFCAREHVLHQAP